MRKEAIMEAYLDRYDLIVVYLHEQFYQGHSDVFYLKNEEGKVTNLTVNNVMRSSRAYTKYILGAPANIVIGHNYQIVADYALTCPLQFGYIVRLERFDKEFYYDGNDLGAIYHNDYTDFALWAPTANRVKVEITKDNKITTYDLSRCDKGVFRLRVEGDFDNAKYLYLINVNGKWNQVVDPYALSCDANQQHGYIIDWRKTSKLSQVENIEHQNNYVDNIIYEANVRDFTSLLPIEDAGKFNAFIMEGLVSKQGNKIGIDHLKELGITHLQLMPVSRFSSVDEQNPQLFYNWGYDQSHYNCLQGSYCSNPNDGYIRINEFKQVVSYLHQNNIKVVLDVVFNHMRSQIESDFENIVPNYYFRMSESGAMSNGSLCGNDLDSTRLMMRKFIVDSLLMWVKNYGIDGFRFDLMGILDIDTMNTISTTLRKVKPDIFLHGEGWDMPTFLPMDKKSILSNQEKLIDIAQFNDFFREHVKGKSNENEIGVAGFGTGDLSYIFAIPACLSGSCLVKEGYVTIFDKPQKSTNYVECHDNATLWDKMNICCANETNPEKIARQKMITAMVILSQGIPFIHAGQEFCRSKKGVQNSYASADQINGIDWNRKDKYLEVSNYVKDLIDFRKKNAALRLTSRQEIEKHVKIDIIDGGVLRYYLLDIDDYGDYHQIDIIINGKNEEVTLEVDNEVQILDATGYHLAKLDKTIIVKPLSVYVLATNK